LNKVCDGIKDCNNALDESLDFCKGTLLCSEGTINEKGQPCRCHTQCSTNIGYLCDGIGDCPPVIGSEWFDKPGFPQDECEASCDFGIPPYNFNCTHPLSTSDFDFPYENFMDCYEDLQPPLTGVFYFTLESMKWCDGVIDCPPNGADEARDRCPERFYCDAANDVISIEINRKCDGVIDCKDGSDENIVNCNKTRHFCPVLGSTKISIEKSLVCDFIVNCDDGSDEKSCHDDGRFYCESGIPLFVENSKKFDGRMDCTDWSDECPIKSKPQIGGLISSRYELVATPALRVVVWLMGILAISGNLIVIRDLIRDLRIIPSTSKSSLSLSKKVFKYNSLLVLNLALADLIMGIYLLILGVNVALHSGNYCSKKIEWLSGDMCKYMGIMVVVSSETSVFTMVLLTSIRLTAVINPFKQSKLPGNISLMLLVSLTWILAIIIAVIPELQQLDYVFKEEAILQQNPFLIETPTHFSKIKLFVLNFLTFGVPNKTTSLLNDLLETRSYDQLKRVMSKFSNRTELWTAKKNFGYYSYNSVCIPNLFVTSQRHSWWYSLAVSVMNFVSFIFVAVSYVFIYYKSTSNEKLNISKQYKKVQVLQRRILRLIVTDFMCWIPVCLMTFLNLAGILIPPICYSISAIVLLPINSALNPFLYSRSFERTFLKLFVKKFKRRNSSSSSTRTHVEVFFTTASVKLGFKKK